MHDIKDLVADFLDRLEVTCKKNNNDYGVSKVKEIRESLLSKGDADE